MIYMQSRYASVPIEFKKNIDLVLAILCTPTTLYVHNPEQASGDAGQPQFFTGIYLATRLKLRRPAAEMTPLPRPNHNEHNRDRHLPTS